MSSLVARLRRLVALPPIVLLAAITAACRGNKPAPPPEVPSTSEIDRPRGDGQPTHGGGIGAPAAGEPAATPKTDNIVVELDQKLMVNGNPVRLPWRLEEATHVLGEPERSLALANTLHVFDGKGIVLYEPPKSGAVKTLSFHFQRDNFKFMPQKLFTGTLKVQGVRIDARATIAQLKSEIKARWVPFGSDAALARYGGWSVAVGTADGRVKNVQIEKL